MRRRMKWAISIVRRHGIVDAGKLAVRAHARARPKVAEAISQAMRWMSTERAVQLASIPHDGTRCPHTPEPSGKRPQKALTGASEETAIAA